MNDPLYNQLGDLLAWIALVLIYAGILFFLGAAIWLGVKEVRQKRRGEQ